MWTATLIAIGGAGGTLLRYGLSLWLNPMFAYLPLGTLVANLLGSFGLGIVAELAGDHEVLGVKTQLIVGTGAMGGFTTYSSFNTETLRIAGAGLGGRALLYAGLTLGGCLLAGLAGAALGRRLRGP